MSAVRPERVTNPYDGQLSIFKWTLAPGDTASPIHSPHKSDKTVTVMGTFNGATVTMKGSCNPDDTMGDILHDPFQNLVTFTSRGTKACMENCYITWPEIANGVSSVIDVYFMSVRR